MRAILFISFLFVAEILSAQNFNVNLSPKHLKKLQTYQSGHKRLKQYYKFYRKDSLNLSKDQNKKYKRELDSTYRAERKRDKLQRRLSRRGLKLPDNYLNNVDSSSQQLARYWRLMNDTSQSDSLRMIAKAKVKAIVVEKARANPDYQNFINQDVSNDSLSWKRLSSHVPGLDTLSALFDSSSDDFFSTVERSAESALKRVNDGKLFGEDFNKAEQLHDLPEKYRRQYQGLTNKDSLQARAKSLATSEAVRQFEENAPIGEAQQQVGRLLSKYREFTNSSDLTSATRRTSIKGKSIRERLVIGGNFNVVSTQPLSIDLSPQLGYRFTTKFFVGLGINYRCTFGDSIRYSHYVSSSNTSLSGWISYDVIKRFYATAEWERSGITFSSNDRSNKEWRNNYFVGAGKRILVHPKLYLVISARYNINNDKQNPVYVNRFQIRMGFQLSELAGRGQRKQYDPNN